VSNASITGRLSISRSISAVQVAPAAIRCVSSQASKPALLRSWQSRRASSAPSARAYEMKTLVQFRLPIRKD